MRFTFAFSIVAAALIIAGCNSQNNNNPGLTGAMNSNQAEEINRQKNAFETSQDPPITAETHYAAGRLAESSGDTAAAVAQYKEALKLDPKLKKAVYRTAVCQSELQKFPEAVAAWKKYIELTGNEAKGYSNLGFCYELAGDTDLAESSYLRGIEKEPKNVPCRTNYGLMLARLGRTTEAMLQLQAVLTPAEVHYNLASVLEHQGRREAAKGEYRRALDLNPSFDDAKERLAALEQQ
jgi:superkiller protein 3